MAINFRGYVFDDSGSAVSGATVQLLETGTSTEEASTTTNSSGLWSFSESDEDRYDIKVTSGASVRYRNWDDQIQLKEIDIRNNTGNTTPALTATNLTNNASNKVAIFRGANSTRADGDEIYLSFELADDGGNIHEFARITAEAVDVSNGSEDGQIRFGVSVGGTMTDVFTINATAAGATDMTFDVSGDLTLDADGGDVFFKDGGTTFGSATNNSGELIIKSGTTTALTFSGANVAVAGDLTITGDDLVMGTNTDGYVLVADGTNYNPVAVSGDIAITNAGVTSIASGVIVNADVNSSAAIAQSKLNLTDASTSAKGIAQFSSDNFAASSGTITIKDGGIVTAELADDAVTSAKIADDAVVTASIADDAITSALIADDAVVTAAIAADAITGAEIADDAIDSEHYTDGSIDTAHLANDAVTNAKIADDAIDSEHYTDASIDFAHIQNVAANSILARNANSSGVLSEVALTNTQILIGDGTGFTAAALSGDATMTNAGVVSLAAAQTNVNSLLATDMVIGEDAQTQIDFETNNEIHFDADNAQIVNITSEGVAVADSKFIEFESAAGTPTTDDTAQGVVIEFLAAEAITQWDAVYVSSTTGRVGRANATAAGTMPAIGVAIEAQGSAGSSVRVLTHGIYRDDGGFGGNLTPGAEVYAPESDGNLTATRPSDDGDFVQVMGVAVGVRSVFINPSLTLVEHA